ncbi:MAG: hypothetical protein FJ147_27390 [Deltaproteobacteria bacterium]|nr:hypothetical protein [Deltaproteobacteria bacterium]
MPRGPRLDAPEVLHHVMARGLARQVIFRDDQDRGDFVRRLATLAEADAWQVYAWAVMPNHFHLLVRMGSRPLARSMRSLLTGYAGMFNRRHHRSGHLFQNRYKSIVCEEELYLLALVRYLHLNPLRAGIVRDLAELGQYAYSGHAALVGTQHYPWQDTVTILKHFAATPARARQLYWAFVAEGEQQGHRPEFQGGGLRRSMGGWAAVQELRQGREGYRADERILGSSTFVEQVQREVQQNSDLRPLGRYQQLSAEELLAHVCRILSIPVEGMLGNGRQREVSRVREGVAYLWIEGLSRSGQPLAPLLGVRAESVYKAARRGREDGQYWWQVLETYKSR